jgi:hypothetical protein
MDTTAATRVRLWTPHKQNESSQQPSSLGPILLSSELHLYLPCDLSLSGDLRSSGILRSVECSSVPTFRDNLSVPSSKVNKSKKKPFFLDVLTLEDGTDRLSRNVGTELHSTLRNIPNERRSHLSLSGFRLKLCVYKFLAHITLHIQRTSSFHCRDSAVGIATMLRTG